MVLVFNHLPNKRTSKAYVHKSSLIATWI